MMKLLILIILISIIHIKSFSKNDLIDKYRTEHKRIDLLVYLVPNACNKCKSNLDLMIDCLTKKIGITNINVIGFVYAKRTIEVNYFKKQFLWNFPLYKVDYELNEDLGIDSNNDLVVLDSLGEIIYQGNMTSNINLQSICNKIANIVNKK